MSTEKKNSSTIVYTFSLQSMGFMTWLVFFILKLTNVIDWSWFWVWFPLWIPIAVSLVIWIIVFIIIWILLSTDR